MKFSKEELTLIRESLKCNLAVHLSLFSNEKRRLDDAEKNYYQIGQNYNKRTMSKLTVARDELIKQKKVVDEYENFIMKLNILIDKLNDDLT